jgi:hypothetical protein
MHSRRGKSRPSCRDSGSCWTCRHLLEQIWTNWLSRLQRSKARHSLMPKVLFCQFKNSFLKLRLPCDQSGDVLRGLQVVEAACGIPSSLMGETLPVSTDMDTYTIRQPLGKYTVNHSLCLFCLPLSKKRKLNSNE